jgi:hypothetical protein
VRLVQVQGYNLGRSERGRAKPDLAATL